ncbi:MAG: electron transfer flavoprotein subunit alpha/FixB family protein [Chloroflexota bacterium]|nr:electron transfer flavoprotein subunit alpha/FixB family protein [Chloroflexota bacterium]MEC9099302.1 electron transfer flavoprotein subunit alpha/FixB family protein [Chloroflexota bacterium]MEC9107227.1 electron transfer flavoprotein subunit alpha/FixB family protein [Chloroflexota bacterium]
MKVLSILVNENEKIDDSSLEVFSFVDNLPDIDSSSALVFGGDKLSVSKLPVDEIFFVSTDNEVVNPNDILFTIDKFIDENKFDIIIFQKDDLSNYVAPSISFRKAIPYLPDVKKFITKEKNILKLVRPIHGESAEAIYSVSLENSVILKMRKSSFEPKQLSSVDKDVKEILLQHEKDKTFNILETNKAEPEGIQLDDADIVISGGRGIGGKEGFEKIKELANILNGAVGASRAAVESEWIETSQLVGLTGKWISPNLYFTFGISGASQHLAGCINSKNIVAVNNDPDASIFLHSKFGVIADCNEFLNEVIEEIKNIQ